MRGGRWGLRIPGNHAKCLEIGRASSLFGGSGSSSCLLRFCLSLCHESQDPTFPVPWPRSKGKGYMWLLLGGG